MRSHLLFNRQIFKEFREILLNVIMARPVHIDQARERASIREKKSKMRRSQDKVRREVLSRDSSAEKWRRGRVPRTKGRSVLGPVFKIPDPTRINASSMFIDISRREAFQTLFMILLLKKSNCIY